MRIIFAILCLLGTARACQESCVVFNVSSTRGKLLDFEGRPIKRARLIIRETSSGDGAKTMCGARKGRVLREIKTDNKGRFELGQVQTGEYWVTLLDDAIGESFLVEVDLTRKAKPFEFKLGEYAGRCYLIDIERNVTIPPWGAKKPVTSGVVLEETVVVNK